MSCIKSNDTVATERATFYRAILRTKILDVCRKIHFNDSHVTWIIFDPYITRQREQKELSETSISTNTLPLQGNDYAYCKIENNEIYISTEVVRQIANPMKTQIHSQSSQNIDMPTAVIIDEITHIQTKRGHGNTVYNKQYQKNTDLYLGNIFRAIT